MSEEEELEEKDCDQGQIIVRHSEPGDAEALHRVFSGPQAIEGTLQLPLPSVAAMRKRYADLPEGPHSLANPEQTGHSDLLQLLKDALSDEQRAGAGVAKLCLDGFGWLIRILNLIALATQNRAYGKSCGRYGCLQPCSPFFR